MRTTLRVALGAAAAVAVTAGLLVTAPWANAVADGQNVPDGKYKFVASLSMPAITRPDGSVYASACSGALIDRQWIISAGHCFHDGARNRISGPPRYVVDVTLGQATRSGTTGQRRTVVEVRQSDTADVAIAKLDAPVRGIAPLRLANKAPKAGDVLRLAGWGGTNSDGGVLDRPDRMQTGKVKVTTVNATEVLVNGLAPKPTTSACPYDSGAPYFVSRPGGPVLVATEVEGPDCPHSASETTARTDVLRAWIRAQIKS